MAEPEVAERAVTIQNVRGLHARAATKLVHLASKYPCEIMLAKDGHEINGKSIMGVLMLAAGKGAIVTIRCRGEKAAEALTQLIALFDDKFGEGV